MVIVVAVQFVLILQGEVVGQPASLLMIILCAFFFLEVAARLCLVCAFESDSFAFIRSANVVDAAVVFLDVVVIVANSLSQTPIGTTSSIIKLFRVIRIARFVKFKDNAARSGQPDPKLKDDLNSKGDVGQVKLSARSPYTGTRGVRYGDGSVYQGDWVADFEDGVGQLTLPGGDSYKGGFKRGQKQGRGVYIFSSGDQFRGSFANNKKNGRGTYIWADGDKFECSFLNGVEDGKATFYSTDGRVVDYYFSKGVEVPPPKDEVEQRAAAENFKGVNYKEILSANA